MTFDNPHDALRAAVQRARAAGAPDIIEVPAAHVIDLGTPEGIVEHFRSLPTENLEAIAARPIDLTNATLVTAAQLELVVRKETNR